ncbi:FUSC family protein [Leifsonia sp. A12D58]|uniref:FUSC family protein n=1 Tax=Leifsonia sp. A12D58 TaxID=3397674 RepID=UPI0039E1CEFE
MRALDIEVASRAALAVALPLIVLVAIGRIEWVAYASFGGMTALYGRAEVYRVRMRTVTIGAVCLLVCIGLGLAMAVTAAPLVVQVVGLVVVIAGGLLVGAMGGLFPPTPIFFVFAYVVCAQAPTPSDEVVPRFLAALITAVFAWLLTMSGSLLRRYSSERSDALFKELKPGRESRLDAYRDPRVWLAIVQNVVGALLAGGLAMLVGIGHPYWAVVSVIAVTPPPGAAHSISRAIHRIIGTCLGVLVTGLVLYPDPPIWVLIVVIVVSQFGAEILVGKHYGAALLFITPLALTVAHLAAPVPVSGLLIDRAVETALGGIIAIALVLLAKWLFPPGPQSAAGSGAPATAPVS